MQNTQTQINAKHKLIMKDIKNFKQQSYFQLDQSSMTTKGVEHKGQDPQDISFELLIKIRE